MLDLHIADITYQGPHFLVKRFGVVKATKWIRMNKTLRIYLPET